MNKRRLAIQSSIDFMRVFSPQFYGITIDHVIGSEVKRRSRMEKDRLVV